VNKKTLVVLCVLGFVVFLAVTTYLMVGNRKNRVEVCMEFQGRTMCKVASGPTKDDAQRAATDAACALIASGMTDTQQCSHSRPVSVKWLE